LVAVVVEEQQEPYVKAGQLRALRLRERQAIPLIEEFFSWMSKSYA